MSAPNSSKPRTRIAANGVRSRFYVGYSRAPEHPMKMRVERWMRGALGVREVRATSPSGILYELQTDDYVQGVIIRSGAYEPETLTLMQRLLGPGDTMVDIGGHIGQFALHAAQRVGARGMVVVAEPNPEAYQRLLRNIALNGFEHIVPVLGAIACEAGRVRFVVPADHNSSAARVSSDTTSSRSFHVLASPLQPLLEQVGASRVDFLKIDVEGYEQQVLESLDLESPLRPRHIVLELIGDQLAQQGASEDDVVGMLRDADYELTDVRGRSFAGSAELPESNLWARDRRVRDRQPSMIGGAR